MNFFLSKRIILVLLSIIGCTIKYGLPSSDPKKIKIVFVLGTLISRILSPFVYGSFSYLSRFEACCFSPCFQHNSVKIDLKALVCFYSTA